MDEPLCEYFPAGIPELGIPPGAHVFLWIAARRYAYYVERNEYDHGVIWNHMMQDRSVPVIPGPGVVEHLALVMGARQPASPSSPPPSSGPAGPGRAHLRLLGQPDRTRP